MHIAVLVYAWACFAFFVVASLAKAPPRVVMELGLCCGLGLMASVGTTAGKSMSFWLLLLFSPIVLVPLAEWWGVHRSGTGGLKEASPPPPSSASEGCP